MEPDVSYALGMTWEYSVPTTPPDDPAYLTSRRGHVHYTTEALTPRAALNKAQTTLDSVYGPGRWLAAQAVMLTSGPHRIIVERVRE